MSKKDFKTESKRLLDLMANSIYTNTDIFLRELISNASDALDKKRYLALTDTSIDNSDLSITLELDNDKRQIIISDNGIGMNEEDLDNNLGTIAKSGSLDFKQALEKNSEVDIIGQFGVGFYSGFMVADKITVITKKYDSNQAYQFESDGASGYTIEPCEKKEVGTQIILHIKEKTEAKDYNTYLDEFKIKSLVKKYSDYIRYPIKMEVTESVYNEETKEYKDERVVKVLNSMQPLWKKSKQELKEEDYLNFYQEQFFDYEKPLKTLHFKVEGNASYTALLYLPKQVPYNYYTSEYKVGLKLFSKGVFIKDEASELISPYFKFMKGLIDSDDLNLNISRELLQQDYQVNLIKKSLDKKVKNLLETMLKNERETYEQFFESFGLQLKYGCYEEYGSHKDVLQDLLLFKSSFEDKMVTLKEYVSRMKEDQKEIYYASGEAYDKIKELPQLEKVLDKGYEVLYFKDHVDEFMINMLREYDQKTFKSINKGELDLDSAEEKAEREKQSEEHKDLIQALKDILKDKVTDVKLSSRLKSYPVCLVSDDHVSIEMEKVLKQLNEQNHVKANKILEINPQHELFKALSKAKDNNQDLNDYANILYDQALLIAGLNISDPISFSQRLSKLMIDSIK